MRETKVDALAIAMGTSHGAYKFSRKPDGDILAMNVIEEIHKKLPNTHLVMHGSSSVPQDLQDIINKFGGKMPQTWGVPVEEIQRGIKHGVRKINIDTDNRMAITGQIRKVLPGAPGRVRSAQVSEARAGRDDQGLQGALRGVRHRRPGVEDQEGHPAGRDGQALRQSASSIRSSPDAASAVSVPPPAWRGAPAPTRRTGVLALFIDRAQCLQGLTSRLNGGSSGALTPPSHDDKYSINVLYMNAPWLCWSRTKSAKRGRKSSRLWRQRLGIAVRKTANVIIGTFCIERRCALLHDDRDFAPMRAPISAL